MIKSFWKQLSAPSAVAGWEKRGWQLNNDYRDSRACGSWKTELIKALTGVDTDRLKEEKERGISIDIGFAPFYLPRRKAGRSRRCSRP